MDDDATQIIDHSDLEPTPAHRVAVISDIHANLTALETVFAYLDKEEIKEVYCLGDIVGYGASSVECVEFIQQRNVTCVQGNHDAQVREPRDPRMRMEAVAGLILAENQLSRDAKDWLAELPCQRAFPQLRALLVHGAITDRDDYILSLDSVFDNLSLLRNRHADCQVCFFGHTHLAMVLTNEDIHTSIVQDQVFDLSVCEEVLVNPGSVGQPRDGCPHASFAIYCPDQQWVKIMRLPYDIALEQKRMEEANLPIKSRIRLGEGR